MSDVQVSCASRLV